MKKTLIVLAIFSLAGCAFIGHQKSAYDACMAETQPGGCKEKTVGIGNTVGQIAGTITSVIPVPAVAVAAPVVNKVAGALAGVLAAIILGNGILKKKENPNV